MADVANECERLTRDFGRLALADVDGAIVTQRRLTWSRRPSLRLEKSVLPSKELKSTDVFGLLRGVEIGDLIPQTVEECKLAPIWYVPTTGEPVVNSVGQSLVLDSGWSKFHQWELTGAHAVRAAELLDRASAWTFERWGMLSGLLWPDRGSIASASGCNWIDVVNRVSELAKDATLPKPRWSVIVGRHRGWIDIEIWRRRNADEFGGLLEVSPDDVVRIADEPEVVYSKREHWLRDSETTLEWLAKRLAEMQDIEPETERPADGLSDDGLSLRWGGNLYSIKTSAADVMKLLVDSFNSGFPYLSEEYLKNETETETDMRHLVRNGGLSDVVIREVGSNGKTVKGKWGLIDPKKLSCVQQIHT